jgi:hypothetical protein
MDNGVLDLADGWTYVLHVGGVVLLRRESDTLKQQNQNRTSALDYE